MVISKWVSQTWYLNAMQPDIEEIPKSSHCWPIVRGINQWLVDSPHRGPVMFKAFPCHHVIQDELVSMGRRLYEDMILLIYTDDLVSHLYKIGTVRAKKICRRAAECGRPLRAANRRLPTPSGNGGERQTPVIFTHQAVLAPYATNNDGSGYQLTSHPTAWVAGHCRQVDGRQLLSKLAHVGIVHIIHRQD